MGLTTALVFVIKVETFTLESELQNIELEIQLVIFVKSLLAFHYRSYLKFFFNIS